MSLYQRCLEFVTKEMPQSAHEPWAAERAGDLQRFVLSLSADERKPKTLRDEFAMVALTALIARDSDEVLQAIKDSGFDPIRVQCETAYKIANAMMAERARQAKGDGQ